MSISTKRGDGGQTGLSGGIRVSKADLRVESYGSVDELNTVLGLRIPVTTPSTTIRPIKCRSFTILPNG